MFNKPLQRKVRTSTQTQLQQYAISIQLGEKVELIAMTPELWQCRSSPWDEGGGGGGQPSRPPWDNGERSQKNCFSALWASFWSENTAGAAPRAPSLDPPLSGHDSHVLSIQFGDNHVVWSEANYYCSWHLAKKLMFNCIIQPVNSWIKSTCKITFIGLAAQ